MCSGTFLTYNMSVICCNSHKVKICWECIHLLKACFDETFIWLFRKTVASTLFKILYISSTFTNKTIPSISISFSVLWNAWFSKMFCKIHWSNVFLFFHMCFLKMKTQHFSLHFLFLCFESSLFCFRKKLLLSLPFL